MKFKLLNCLMIALFAIGVSGTAFAHDKYSPPEKKKVSQHNTAIVAASTAVPQKDDGTLKDDLPIQSRQDNVAILTNRPFSITSITTYDAGGRDIRSENKLCNQYKQ